MKFALSQEVRKLISFDMDLFLNISAQSYKYTSKRFKNLIFEENNNFFDVVDSEIIESLNKL